MRKVLDHGYVELIDVWGSDEAIIEAARMSTDKGFKGWGPLHINDCRLNDNSSFDKGCDCSALPGDEKLLRYLYKNKHHTPFEMAGVVFEIKAPIFVFREWQRHRTQSFNEMSARYIPLPDENYMPTVERLMMNAGSTNKQAGTNGSAVLTELGAESFRKELAHQYEEQQSAYEGSLSIGVPKELARLVIPVGRYSKMRASANLRNWLGFLTLRQDQAAQYEIRLYANIVAEVLAERFPRTMELYNEG